MYKADQSIIIPEFTSKIEQTKDDLIYNCTVKTNNLKLSSTSMQDLEQDNDILSYLHCV